MTTWTVEEIIEGSLIAIGIMALAPQIIFVHRQFYSNRNLDVDKREIDDLLEKKDDEAIVVNRNGDFFLGKSYAPVAYLMLILQILLNLALLFSFVHKFTRKDMCSAQSVLLGVLNHFTYGVMFDGATMTTSLLFTTHQVSRIDVEAENVEKYQVKVSDEGKDSKKAARKVFFGFVVYHFVGVFIGIFVPLFLNFNYSFSNGLYCYLKLTNDNTAGRIQIGFLSISFFVLLPFAVIGIIICLLLSRTEGGEDLKAHLPQVVGLYLIFIVSGLFGIVMPLIPNSPVTHILGILGMSSYLPFQILYLKFFSRRTE